MANCMVNLNSILERTEMTQDDGTWCLAAGPHLNPGKLEVALGYWTSTESWEAGSHSKLLDLT
jgi:hypothetical protein